ncbi:MAG: hypothetical protein CUN55_07650 [Phototrophicales bacterium]|nr:MAG: hypothetical protein CUN55_07650 [Phototrophicales bacterium]
MKIRYSQPLELVVRGATVGLLLGLVFAAGFFTRDIMSSPTTSSVRAQDDPTALQFTLLDEVHQLVVNNFYTELPPNQQLQYAAIRGYLGALGDPYSFFNEPPVARSESDALAGRYGGIGVEIKRNVLGEIELFPYPDSPAFRAGIRDGDILLAINGEPVTPEQNLDVIRQALRGEVTDSGNGVEITVRSIASNEEVSYQIPFEEIRIPSVLWRMLPDEPLIGYINIMSFTSRTPDEISEAVNELNEQGMQALILDLRNNSGGLLQESIDVADAFLEEGIIVIEQSRVSGEVIEVATEGSIIPPDMPLIILVNDRTASASEVVAGALQQNDRALLIGQRTRGKGSVQYIFGLSDGSSFRITGAIWLTPNRTPLDGVGLTPDIEMIPDINGREVELDEAIRQIREQIIVAQD